MLSCLALHYSISFTSLLIIILSIIFLNEDKFEILEPINDIDEKSTILVFIFKLSIRILEYYHYMPIQLTL